MRMVVLSACCADVGVGVQEVVADRVRRVRRVRRERMCFICVGLKAGGNLHCRVQIAPTVCLFVFYFRVGGGIIRP